MKCFIIVQIGEENYMSFTGGKYVGEVTGALNARFWLPYSDFFTKGCQYFGLHGYWKLPYGILK
jgi:hypothetical protein